MSDVVFDRREAVGEPTARGFHLRVGVVVRGALLCAAYYAGCFLGYALIFPSSYVSIVWPPNTILLVALLLSPARHWPWILLLALPVHVLAHVQIGVSLTAALLYYAFDCVLVPLVAAALRRAGVDDLDLRDLRKSIIFIAVTTISVAVGSLVWSPLIASFWGGGDRWTLWGLVCMSNLLPFLIATPSLVIGLSRGPELMAGASRARVTEFAILSAGLLACALGVFGLAPQAVGAVPALFHAPLPFLLWAAVRFGPAGLSCGFLIFALMAMFSAIAGFGPFVAGSASETVLRLQVFLLALYVPLLVLASVVAERRGKEEALRRSEARYRAVVEDQTELICRFLPDGTYTFVNDAYCRYFQRAREDLMGRTFWSLLPAEGHQAAREFLASITPEHPVATREHEVLAPGGEPRWQQWRDRGFFDDRGRILEYQAVGRDITERKHAEQAMQSLAHAERLALVGELTGSIAHEINQPLCAILSNADAAELVLRSPSPSLDLVREILADIRKDDLRASEVIQRIRALLRKREFIMAPLDIDSVADEVVKLILPDARRRHVALETEFGSGLPAVRADRVHLQQVLLNLLINGMDAMQDMPDRERRITVRTRSDGGRSVEVSVSDTGRGIPAEGLGKVFESFYTTKEHGMGLGLAIARSIIELHDGRIWARSEPGGGATFSFSLPAVAQQSGSKEDAPSNGPPASLRAAAHGRETA
jgi:PAS domain S-box-containing protein